MNGSKNLDSEMDNVLHIYTDGACSGNPGVGGWAAVLIYRGHEKEISGSVAHTTNNQMELLAVIKALECIKKPVKTVVYSDSSYVINGFRQGWVINWQRNNWLNSARKPVSNKEMWQTLSALVDKYNVSFVKVKGHADDKYNNRCDALAVQAWKNYKRNKDEVGNEQ